MSFIRETQKITEFGNQIEQCITVKKKNRDSKITIDEIGKMYKELQASLGSRLLKCNIVGHNSVRRFQTIKSASQTWSEAVQDEEQYLKGREKNTAEHIYNEFFQVQFYVFTDKTKVKEKEKVQFY